MLGGPRSGLALRVWYKQNFRHGREDASPFLPRASPVTRANPQVGCSGRQLVRWGCINLDEVKWKVIPRVFLPPFLPCCFHVEKHERHAYISFSRVSLHTVGKTMDYIGHEHEIFLASHEGICCQKMDYQLSTSYSQWNIQKTTSECLWQFWKVLSKGSSRILIGSGNWATYQLQVAGELLHVTISSKPTDSVQTVFDHIIIIYMLLIPHKIYDTDFH